MTWTDSRPLLAAVLEVAKIDWRVEDLLADWQRQDAAAGQLTAGS